MFLPLLLHAHGSHGDGMMAGFTHPILGMDHAFAIFGTGILGYLLNPKKSYLLIISFVIAMIIGGLLGIDNEATLFIEKVIAFSVLAIGLMIAYNNKINLFLAVLLLSIFGFFHGYAHGAEMAETNTALKYVSGYSFGAILLGGVGMLIAKVIDSQTKSNRVIQFFGGILCGFGVMLLFF